MRTSTLRDIILTAAFATTLLSSTVSYVLRGPDTKAVAVEFRTPPPSPAFDWDDANRFPDAFDAHCGDCFGMRSLWVRLHSRIRLLWLGASPTAQVVVGRDDWLFHTGDQAVASHRGLNPMAAAELQSWRRALEERSLWLGSAGIPYLFFVAPDKHTVYEDKLPTWMNRARPQTRYEQWQEFLDEECRFPPLDLRGALSAARRRESAPIYFRFGTHWNAFGAQAAYEAVVERLDEWFPGLEPRRRAECVVGEWSDGDDNWGDKLLIADLMNQSNPRCEVREARSLRVIAMEQGSPRTSILASSDQDAPTAVVFHDSFSQALMHRLALNFSRITFVWQRDFDPVVVLREKPDVVLHEIVERYLVYPPNRLPSQLPRPTRVPTERVAPGRYENPFHPSFELVLFGDRYALDAPVGRRWAEKDGGRKTLAFRVSAGRTITVSTDPAADGCVVTSMTGSVDSLPYVLRRGPTGDSQWTSRDGTYRLASGERVAIHCDGDRRHLFRSRGSIRLLLEEDGPDRLRNAASGISIIWSAADGTASFLEGELRIPMRRH